MQTKNWIKSGLIYGIGMLVTMEIIFPLVDGQEFESLVTFLGKSAIWIVVGLGLAYFVHIPRVIKK
jgi:uncharacterized membrane protein